MNSELIEKVESLRVLLIAKATGREPEDDDYKRMRSELIAVPRIKALLPRSVHVCRDLAEFWAFIQPKFATYAQRREYLRKEFEPLLSMLEAETESPSDSQISATIEAIGLQYVKEAWHKALERRSTDPEGAITVARTLLETVCKHILEAAEEEYDDDADLPKLYGQAAKKLNLSPSQHSEQVFKQILGGCHTVVGGLGAMRNRHSDAHGKNRSGTKPASRHAELAVNLAGAMATFLLQTWEAGQK